MKVLTTLPQSDLRLVADAAKQAEADGYDGACTDVSVLARLHREAEVDALLEGWQERRTDPDGLAWLMGRTGALAA